MAEQNPDNWITSASLYITSLIMKLTWGYINEAIDVGKHYYCDTFKWKMGPCENLTFMLESMGCHFLLKTYFNFNVSQLPLYNYIRSDSRYFHQFKSHEGSL